MSPSLFGEPDETDTDRKRTALLPSVRGREWPRETRSGLVKRQARKHFEGVYYLEWPEKGRRVRLSVGKDAQEAAARRQRKQAELNAVESWRSCDAREWE